MVRQKQPGPRPEVLSGPPAKSVGFISDVRVMFTDSSLRVYLNNFRLHQPNCTCLTSGTDRTEIASILCTLVPAAFYSTVTHATT